MLSKKMYDVLSLIPKFPDEKAYSVILAESKLNDNDLWNILCEANYRTCEYINAPAIIRNGNVSLNEKGEAAFEEYQQYLRNQEVLAKSLKVSKIAMVAAIASAITALLSLIQQLC